jgi:hypothetical protein
MNQSIDQPSAGYHVPSLTTTAPTLWGVLWRWGLATAGGAMLAFIPAYIGIALMFGVRGEAAAKLIALVTAAAMATPLALFQRLMLGKLSAIKGWWVRATVGGAMAGIGILMLDDIRIVRRLLRRLLGDLYYHHSLLVFFGQISLVIGICQWLVLRRSVERAGWWIGANLVAGLLIGWIGGLRGEEFILGIQQLLAYILITGITLRLLLGQRRFD